MKKIKIIQNSILGEIIPDPFDLQSRILFDHLFPEGKCWFFEKELLYFLAEAHGWEIEESRIEEADTQLARENLSKKTS